jgi:hypothetical protein
VANSTERTFRHITSGRRAVVAAYVQSATRLPALYSFAWADASAALIESGWSTASRSLLAWLLDPPLVERAARILLGGMPPAPVDLSTRFRHELHDLRPANELPPWATIGVHLAGETIYARLTLDLDAAETADARQWPPVSVAAYQSGADPVCVLVEVGPGGPPTLFTADQGRRLSTAVLKAASIVEAA